MIRQMTSLEQFTNDRLAHGRTYFTREEALATLGIQPPTLAASITRMIKRRKLANPRHGFYLILRPEDQISGAPDPICWIDALMKYQGLEYRIGLLQAAAFHGSTHQAAMVFQVIVPRQLRNFELGRHRLQFIFQSPKAFALTNQAHALNQIKSDTGFATVAGVELTLLDCTRYFHQAGGLSGVAQVAKDIGAKAHPRLLAKLATAYENATVRRLGYLLDQMGNTRLANALEPFVKKNQTMALLEPAIKPLIASFADTSEKNTKWKLIINENIEVDF
jgi:predicted transcriptional regulator of viral defense system